MALAHNLGFPRTGCDRAMRARHWQVQKEAGIELLPVGDFAWYAPEQPHALIDADPQAILGWEALHAEVQDATALGHAVKPVVTGPLSYLWFGQTEDAQLDRLELLDRLLPLYDLMLNRLAGQGVEWVQIDEPILTLELPQAWKNAYERVYNILQRAPLKKLIATYGGALDGNLGLAVNLPVDGLHVDLVQAAEQYQTVLDRLPAYKVLSLGVVDAEDAAPGEQQQHLQLLFDAHERLGDRLWVATACASLRSPVEQAVHKCQEVARLAKAVNQAAERAVRVSA